MSVQGITDAHVDDGVPSRAPTTGATDCLGSASVTLARMVPTVTCPVLTLPGGPTAGTSVSVAPLPHSGVTPR